MCLPACRMAAACGSTMNILSHCGIVFFPSPLLCTGLAEHCTRTGSIQARNMSIHDACTCMHHHPHTYINCRFCHRFEVEGITLPQDGSVGLIVNGVLPSFVCLLQCLGHCMRALSTGLFLHLCACMWNFLVFICRVFLTTHPPARASSLCVVLRLTRGTESTRHPIKSPWCVAHFLTQIADMQAGTHAD